MKKIVVLLMIIVLIVNVLCGCRLSQKDDGKFTVLCSVFPVYDWVCEITKDAENVSVELLVDSGVDMHNYQASAADIIKITDCDAFIYVGGISDSWAEDAIAQVDDKSKIINLMNYMDKEKLISNNDDSHNHDHHADDYSEYDEHIWLSIDNAKILCEKISKNFCDMDSDNCAIYKKNTLNYTEKLSEIDSRYSNLSESTANSSFILCGRQPFKYLCRDYGLNCFAAFEGCSSESEASFETVISLAKKADEIGAKSVAVIKGDTEDLAKTIISNTTEKTQNILKLDSMQTQSMADIKAGATYIGIMESNLSVFEQLLED